MELLRNQKKQEKKKKVWKKAQTKSLNYTHFSRYFPQISQVHLAFRYWRSTSRWFTSLVILRMLIFWQLGNQSVKIGAIFLRLPSVTVADVNKGHGIINTLSFHTGSDVWLTEVLVPFISCGQKADPIRREEVLLYCNMCRWLCQAGVLRYLFLSPFYCSRAAHYIYNAIYFFNVAIYWDCNMPWYRFQKKKKTAGVLI